ncbi:hypothetical protein [Streptomyces sp. NRRL B-3229]|uniref:hypothetical protein n=1 Tax=Streptomyces sp. NRRL B-3229 TaxID=1463836 RepID=UPI00131E263C|nr:hypothetical protein [Streptomyces sp. NRRL B-3229]
MAIRTAITGAAVVLLAAAGPLTGAAHAQTDPGCSDFAFQQGAQAQFDQSPADPDRLDEDQGRGESQGRDEDQGRGEGQGRDQGHGRDESQGWDQGQGWDESQGWNNGIACEAAPPRREPADDLLPQDDIDPEVLLQPETAPEVLLQPETTVANVATVAPTLGVQGGSGGSVGPAGFERAIGVALALAGAGLAGTYVVRRRREAGRRARDVRVTGR